MKNFEVIANGSALITLSATDKVSEVNNIAPPAKNKSGWIPWGVTDNWPGEIIRLIYNNNMKPQLLKNSSNFLVGKGLYAYKEVVEDGKLVRERIDLSLPEYKEVNAFLKDHKVYKQIQRQAKNYTYFSNFFVQLLMSDGNDGVNRSVKGYISKDCNHVRAQEANNKGIVENFFVSSYFGSSKPKPVYNEGGAGSNVTMVPAVDETDKNKNTTVIFHGKDHVPGNPYYSMPDWYGTREWTELANYIPAWHKKGIENGYNIKYHIAVDTRYFSTYNTDEDKVAAYKELVDNMNAFLSGAEGNQKAFVSQMHSDATGKVSEYVKITPVKNNIWDEAYTKLYDQSNAANTAGHDIHPTLANISEGGKLSSGSEMRNAYNIHVALKTPVPRSLLLEPLYLVKEWNEWPEEIEFAFEDVEITTTDNNAKGVKTKED